MYRRLRSAWPHVLGILITTGFWLLNYGAMAATLADMIGKT
jgi:hypothetical protein